ncbi:Ig-like domain-containing protein [Methanosphaera sp. ISO3-F5]|uniref:Ig-like domain-containing protein n=1 Tax=Methanosphaera sp. ISO3-F5 TaxID=1452353 RepID=UPI002B25CD21|nr:Ig-like domain-containing protein [Methanosphaera sp. ISO3-F5]WQH64721.1 Ig-like domain-containing protein [Methanosphaera sp. ISO3-F5]
MILKKTQIIIFLLMTIALMSVSVATNIDDDNNQTLTLTHDSLTTNMAQTIKNEKSVIAENTNINKKTPKSYNIKSYEENSSNNTQYTNNNQENRTNTIIITPETFSEYITDGLLANNIACGTTLDFTGKFDGEQYAFTINKPVNIISSKNDAFICFYSTQNLEQTYGTPNHSFLITKEGSGTNVTGIYFENTMIVTQRACNVTFDNLTVYCSSDYGWGLGSPSIRNSENVTIKNSYFNTTEDNTWVSTVVFAASKNCLLENCTVTGSNFIGNLVYATTYNVELTDEYGNNNITIRGNRIIGRNLTPNLQTCYSVCLIGDNMTVENNYIENSNSYLVMSQYHDHIYHADGTSRKLIIRNNSFGPGKIGVEFDPCTIVNNTFYGTVKLDVLNTTIQENNTLKDENSNPYTIEEESTLTPTLVNITAPSSYIYDETNTFTVTVTNLKNNQKIREGCLEIYSDGKLYKNITISDETTTFTYNNRELGEHHVRVWYYPNNNTLMGSQKVHTIKSEKIQGQLTIETKNNPEIGETITLKVSYTLNKERNHRTNITFNLPGQKTFTVEAVNNTATIETKITPDYIRDILGGREQSIKVSATTNDSNIEITGTTRKLGVQKETTNITITPTTAKIGEKTLITATINSRNNINTGSITFTDEEGNIISTSNIKNNQATTAMTYNTSTTHNITATYSGTIHFKNSNKTSSILVTRYDTLLECNSTIAKYGEKTSITGKLTDENNKAINDADITITINGVQNKVTTNNNGEYTLNTNINKVGQNKATITYNGNNNYNPTSTTNTITINKQDTTIIINNIPATKCTQSVTITGTLKDKLGNNIPNANIKLSINNKETTITTNNQGTYTYTITSYTTGSNNITVTYTGNTNYNSAHVQTTYTVNKLDTKITITANTAKYGETITITGKLTDENNKAITNTDITLTLNNNKHNIKTNNNGEYTYTIIADTIGTNNITVTYNGNNNYNPTSTTTTLNVNKQDTTITINNIPTTKCTESVTITGTVKDKNGKTLANQNLNLSINDKMVIIKTDKNGAYSYTTQASTVGTNNLTVTFASNNNYNTATTRTTFTVTKQDTTITLNNIKSSYTSNATIKGKLTTHDGIILTNQNMKLTINGKTVTVKTDENGIFTYKYQTNKAGGNTIIATYNGNSDYQGTSLRKTFIVSKLDLKITINKITTKAYGEKVTIKGTFKDKNGKILGNSKLKLNINGKTATIKTDKNGVFTYKHTTRKVGTNNITISHQGTKNYNKITKKATFKVTKQNLKITLNRTNKVGYGSKVYVKGQLTDKHGKIIKNTVITININGKTIRAKTNSKGIYNHSLTTTKLGSNTITVTYNGNKNYNKITKKATFKVTKQTVKITTNTKQVKGNKKVTITGKLTTKDGKALRNSKVTLTINGKKKTAKTNTKGAYTLTVTAKTGKNTLVAGFAGNRYYNKLTLAKKVFTLV